MEREKILEDIRSSKSYAYKAPDVMARIFVEEQDWERLFLAVKEKHSLDNLQQYTPLLKEGYGPELLKLYEGELRKYAEANVSRTHYQHVAKVLRTMQQIEGGDEVAFRLVTEFKTKYKQRRAMQEELNKVIFT